MSLLDSMKKDVQALREEEQRAEAEAAEKQRIYDELIQPSINKAFAWFREFFEHLEVLEKDNRLSIELPGYGMLRDLDTGDFFFKVDGQEHAGRRQCGRRIRGKAVSFRIQPLARAEAMVEYLESVGLRFERKTLKDRHDQPCGAIFEVLPDFVQSIVIQADLETSSIDLQVRNFQCFGREHLKLAHDQMDQDLLDRIGLYVLGREDQIKHSTMADHLRLEIQRKVEKENRRRTRELESALQERKREDAEDERKRSSLLKLAEMLRGKD